MERYITDSSRIEPPHEVEGKMHQARRSFYELAKSRVRFLNSQEFKRFQTEHRNDSNYLTCASYDLSRAFVRNIKGRIVKKWVTGLEVVVNEDIFRINGKDYSDLIPYVLEHEIYEAWLSAKKGFGHNTRIYDKHLLALRREFLMAEQQGKGDRLLEFNIILDPERSDFYRGIMGKVRRKDNAV